MRKIYLIKKLWYDPMENHNSHGYREHGFVSTLTEAEWICAQKVHESESLYPLKYISDKNGFVPKYTYTELEEIV